MKKISNILILFLSYTFVLLSNITLADNSDEIISTLQKIENEMAKVKTIQCRFIQEKRLSIIEKPIIIKGQIFIQAPDKFAWHSSVPVKYSLVLNGHKLTQWDEDSKEKVSIDLRNKPMFEVIISQMKGWFSGSYTKQTEHYDIGIIKKSPLTLKFLPKSQTDNFQYIKSVGIEFKKDLSYISSIEIIENNSDSTYIKFSDIKLNNPIPKNIWTNSIFRH